MARGKRDLAGFGDIAGTNNNDNINDNVYIGQKKDMSEEPTVTSKLNPNPNFLDKVLGDKKKKKNDDVLTGIYLKPDLAQILDSLGKEGGRGTKSQIVNLALRKYFIEKGLPLKEE